MEIQNLDDVRVFARVVQSGSFSGAARQLGLPKSTVSRRVSALEAQLGARLLQRTTRRLRLTDAGEVLLRRAERMLEEAEAASREVANMQAAPQGTLRISAPADAGLYLADALAAFRKHYPEILVAVTLTNQVEDLVAEGIDVAVRAGNLSDSTLVVRRLTRSNLRLFASPSYLAARGTPERPRDLCDHDCVVFSGQRPSAAWRLTGPGGTHETIVKGSIAANDFGMLRALASSGAGVAMLPEVVAAGLLNTGELVPVLPDYTLGAGNLSLVYPSPRHLSPKVRAFVDFLQSHIERYGHS